MYSQGSPKDSLHISAAFPDLSTFVFVVIGKDWEPVVILDFLIKMYIKQVLFSIFFFPKYPKKGSCCIDHCSLEEYIEI